MNSDLLNRVATDIAKQKAKILDDFGRAYIAQRIDEKKFDVTRMKLVEQQSNDGTRKYWFEQTRGRAKKETK